MAPCCTPTSASAPSTDSASQSNRRRRNVSRGATTSVAEIETIPSRDHPLLVSRGSSHPSPRYPNSSTRLNTNSALADSDGLMPSTRVNQGPAHRLCIEMKVPWITMPAGAKRQK